MAYAAGEQLTMTMNQGLFDIQVDVGTTDGERHRPHGRDQRSRPSEDNHNIYMVAVPKNEALTMLLGGAVGFDVTAVQFDKGQIILSAGQGVSTSRRS